MSIWTNIIKIIYNYTNPWFYTLNKYQNVCNEIWITEKTIGYKDITSKYEWILFEINIKYKYQRHIVLYVVVYVQRNLADWTTIGYKDITVAAVSNFIN